MSDVEWAFGPPDHPSRHQLVVAVIDCGTIGANGTGKGRLMGHPDDGLKIVRAGQGMVCGVLADPLYLVVGFAQALTRDGFDLTRHPFSALSLGDLGWIQIANFVVCGLLFVAAAIGIRRALREARGGTWGALLIGAMGVGMIAGEVLVADSAFGFPPGAPAGQPDVLSWHGTLHALAFIVAFLSWTVAIRPGSRGPLG